MILTVGGNIGCGKSTLLETLKKNGKEVVPEAVEKWGSWLDLFYSDMKRFGFGFQMKVLFDFIDTPPPGAITERSPLDALYIFAKTLFQSETLSHMEYNLFSDYVHKIGWKPDYYIYLRADPEVCFHRIHIRSRTAENGVTLEYIKNVHEMYEKFTQVLKDLGITVFTVDANQTPDRVQDAVDRILYSIF